MVTTRGLEQEVESALLEAGASNERARAAASSLGDEIVQLATKSDLDEGLKATREDLQEGLKATKEDLQEAKQELRAEMREMRDELRAEMREMRAELNDRMDRLERTMWRLAMLGFAMWSATFGALMYAVFG